MIVLELGLRFNKTIGRGGKGQDVRWKGIFVGYSPHSPEWLIFDPRSGNVRASSNVRFAENESGFQPFRREEYEPNACESYTWEPEMD